MRPVPREPSVPPSEAPAATPPESPASAAAATPRRISSAQLFGKGTEVHIEHHGAIYRLRLTALGKLILTK